MSLNTHARDLRCLVRPVCEGVRAYYRAWHSRAANGDSITKFIHMYISMSAHTTHRVNPHSKADIAFIKCVCCEPARYFEVKGAARLRILKRALTEYPVHLLWAFHRTTEQALFCWTCATWYATSQRISALNNSTYLHGGRTS